MIFISYARDDRDLVQKIIDALHHNLGMRTWIDSQIKIGSSFTDDIDKALNSSDVVVVFWTTHSIKSDFVIDEATRAKQAGKLIPVRLEDVKPPPGFGVSQTLDLFGLNDSIPHVDLINEVQTLAHVITDRLRHIDWLHRIKFNHAQSAEIEITARLIRGQRVAVVSGNREIITLMPFYYGLKILGFDAKLILEPTEASGAEVRPLLDDLDVCDVTIFPFLPTTDFDDWFFKLCITRSKRIVFVLFSFLSTEYMMEKFDFLRSTPNCNFIRKKWLSFPLEGEETKETWETIKAITGI